MIVSILVSFLPSPYLTFSYDCVLSLSLMNIIQTQEEIDTHLNVLHIEVTDRYNSFGWGQTSNALNAMMQHFSGHTTSFPDSIAPAPWTWHHPNTDLHHALLGNVMGGGIAYVGVLCNAGYGFGLSANMVGSYQTMNEAVVW